MISVHPVSLEDAIDAFQDEIRSSYWEEHGISDEEAGKALRAVFTAFGVPFKDDALFLRGQLSNAAEIERDRLAQAKYAEKQAQWRKDHPEEAAQQDKINAMISASLLSLQDSIINAVFKPPSEGFTNMLKSPNTKSYTESEEP